MAVEHEIERLLVRLVGDTAQFTASMKGAVATAEAASYKIGASISRIGKSLRRFGTRANLFITTPLVLAGGGLAKLASDAEETGSKFDVTFSGVIKRAHEVADELDKSYGLSALASQRLLSDTGDLLTGFGFTQQQALDLSEQVQKLAVDLASFQNKDPEQASQALTKALLGERESIKLLGIAINETTPEWKALLKQVEASTHLTGTQAKAYATLKMAQQQSKNAIGDYARTQSSFANQSRELKADLEDLGVAYGKVLIPLTKSLISFTRPLIDLLQRMTDGSKRLILIGAGIAAAIGPALLAVGGLVGLVGFAVTGFGSLLSVVLAVVSPIALVTAAIAGLAAVVLVKTGAAGEIVQWFGRQWESLKDFVQPAIDGIKDALTAGDLGLAVEIAWAQIQLAWFKGTQAIREAWIGLTYEIKKVWVETSSTLRSVWSQSVDWIAEGLLRIQGWFDKSFNADAAIAELKRMGEESQKQIEESRKAGLDAAQKETAKAMRGVQANLDALQKRRDDLVQRAAEAAASVAKVPQEALPDIGKVNEGLDRTIQDVQSLKDVARAAVGVGTAEDTVRLAEARAIAAVPPKGVDDKQEQMVAALERIATATETTAGTPPVEFQTAGLA